MRINENYAIVKTGQECNKELKTFLAFFLFLDAVSI